MRIHHSIVRLFATGIAAALMYTTTPAGAEDITGAPIEESLAAAKSRLNLTHEQEEKLAPLMREDATNTRAIMAKYHGTPSPEERQAKFEALRDERLDFRTKLASVLTPEQLMEWDKMRAEALTRAQRERLGDQ